MALRQLSQGPLRPRDRAGGDRTARPERRRPAGAGAAAVRALVVGGGAYGCVCARRLADAGCKVTLLERRTAGHRHAASGGTTRVLRFEYGGEERYTRMTMAAVGRWQELERRSG